MKRQVIIMCCMLALSACSLFRHHNPVISNKGFKPTVPFGIQFMPSVTPQKPAPEKVIDSPIPAYYKEGFDKLFRQKFDSLNRIMQAVPGIINAQRLHADSLNNTNVELTRLNYKSEIQQAILTKIAVDAVASKQDAMAQNIKSMSEVDTLLKRLDTMQIMPYLIIAFFILLFIAATPDLIKAVFALFKRKRLEIQIKKLHDAK